MSKIAEGYKQTEVGVIPGDWNLNTYGEIFEFLTTATYSRAQLNENDEINYVHYGDIHTKCEHFLDCDKLNLPSIKKELLKNYPLLRNGDLIIADASEDYEGVGKSVEVRNIKTKKIISGLHTFLLRDKKETIANGFKGYIHSNKLVKKQMDTLATGLKVYGVSKTNLKKILIPLPPTKAEQTAIATALNDADALITQLEKLIAKKRNIKQGAMQELLRPKKGWLVKKLGDIFKFLNTANNSRADLLESGEVEYIHYGDIHTRWNCFLDCSKNELPFIDKTKVISVPFLEDGDLVVADASEDYEGLGACIEIKNIGKRKIVAGLHTLLLRGDKNVLADGFKGYLRNYQGVKDAMIRVSTGVSVFGISKTNLKEIEILIPSSKEEQNRIAQILSDMDAEIEALEKKLDKYKMLKQGMMQNLLTGRVRLI